MKRGEKEYAKTIYKNALTIDTLDKSLLRSLKKLYVSEEEELPLVIAQATELQKYYDQIQNLQGTSKTNLKKLRDNLEAYIEKYPEDSNGPILLAKYFSLTGNDIKSKELLEKVLEEHPDNLSANLALSALLRKAEDDKTAKKYLQDALFYYPNNQTAARRLERLNS